MRSFDVDALARTLAGDRAEVDPGATIRPEDLARSATLAAPSAPSFGASLPRLAIESASGPSQDADLELIELLGAGGMGAVFLARQRSLRRAVAVKRARDGEAAGPGARALVAEARTSGPLEHPHIVPVHALGADDEGRPVLVMKRIEGRTLEQLCEDPTDAAWPDLIARYGDRTSAILEILVRVADALHFAHERGVVHRDVKPGNVMVGSHGEVYLLDWGIALDLGEPPAEVAVVGTPAYLAPEMLSGAAVDVDARTDVYLLGATLHAALTGRPRHEGDSLLDVLRAAERSDPPDYGPELSEELADLCRRATSREPELRPATAAALRDELGAQLRHRSALALAHELERRIVAVREEVGAPPRDEVLGRADIWQTLLEVRFALGRALAEHPRNEVARRALREGLVLLARSQLIRGDATSAAATAAEVDPPDPELAAGVAAARARAAEARKLAELGAQEVRERDLRGAVRGLGAVLGVCGAALVGLVVYLQSAPGGQDMSMWAITAFDAGVLVAAGAAALAFRRQLLSTRRGRGVTAALATTLLLSTTVDVVGASKGMSPEQVGPFTLLAVASGMAAAAAAFGRAFYLSSAILVAASFVLVAVPDHTPTVIAVATIAAIAIGFRELLRQARGDADAPPG